MNAASLVIAEHALDEPSFQGVLTLRSELIPSQLESVETVKMRGGGECQGTLLTDPVAAQVEEREISEAGGARQGHGPSVPDHIIAEPEPHESLERRLGEGRRPLRTDLPEAEVQSGQSPGQRGALQTVERRVTNRVGSQREDLQAERAQVGTQADAAGGWAGTSWRRW